jgi:hypothetical protein
LEILDLGTDVQSFGNLNATIYEMATCSPLLYVRTSSDGLSWDAWQLTAPNAAIGCTVYAHTYAQLKMAYSSMNYNFGILLNLPSLFSLVLNVFKTGTGGRYPVSPTRQIYYNGSLLDVQQKITDTLGGDTSVINQVQVIGTPYTLSGADIDNVWTGTTGIPTAEISDTNPLYLPLGETDVTASIDVGMDISRLTGTNPAALTLTYGTAVGSATISPRYPASPTIKIVATTAGIITALSLSGKKYSTDITQFSASASDAASIKKYGLRAVSISNPWILNTNIAQYIANNQLALYKDEADVLYGAQCPYQPSVQIGDRITALDLNTGIAGDYWVMGIIHTRSSSTASTEMVLWFIS